MRVGSQCRFVITMRTILSVVLLLVASVVLTLAHPDHSDSWEEFKLKYNKKYESEEDEVRQARLMILH